MYILDEPTTGLHQHDIKKLLEIGLQVCQSPKQEDINQEDFLLMLKEVDVKHVRVMV